MPRVIRAVARSPRAAGSEDGCLCHLRSTARATRRLLAPHDHGSQHLSDYFQDELKFLGIVSSPAFVRVLRQKEATDGQQQALGRHLGDLAGAE